MERDAIAIVTEFWDDLDEGRVEEALALVGEHGAWRPVAGGEVVDGRAGMTAYVRRLQEEGVEFRGHAYAIERDGEHVVVRGVVRYAGRGRLIETQGRWLHRVRNGAVSECLGVPASALA